MVNVFFFWDFRAVADYHSPTLPFNLTAEDVSITVGCSQAIQLCIAALATTGANILIPRPGFPIYETFCKYYGVECRFYDLLPERDWEVDLDQIALLADSNTVAWFVCNPSNPCGSVFKYQHLVKVSEQRKTLHPAFGMRLCVLCPKICKLPCILSVRV